MRNKIKTREEWLKQAVILFKPVFKKHKLNYKKVMAGCGWPRGGKSEVIGQCFAKTWTKDGTTHIFISPTQADSVSVLATLAHELVHAAVGCEHGHRTEFKKAARAIGLEGKLTATTVSATSPLYIVLKRIAKKLGKYPHSKMISFSGKHKRASGGTVSWTKLKSKKIPDYYMKVSPISLKIYGYPLDPLGERMIER